MKNILMILAASLLLMACEQSPKRSISTKEDLTVIKELLIEKFGDEGMISVSLLTNNANDCNFEIGSVTTKDKVYNYMAQMDIVSDVDANLRDAQKKETLVKLSSWNVDEFMEAKEKAIALIESKSKNFSDFKVESLSLNVKDGIVTYMFDLVATRTGGGVAYIGKRVRQGDSYFEFSFSYNPKSKKITSSTKGMNK